MSVRIGRCVQQPLPIDHPCSWFDIHEQVHMGPFETCYLRESKEVLLREVHHRIVLVVCVAPSLVGEDLANEVTNGSSVESPKLIYGVGKVVVDRLEDGQTSLRPQHSMERPKG